MQTPEKDGFARVTNSLKQCNPTPPKCPKLFESTSQPHVHKYLFQQSIVQSQALLDEPRVESTGGDLAASLGHEGLIEGEIVVGQKYGP